MVALDSGWRTIVLSESSQECSKYLEFACARMRVTGVRSVPQMHAGAYSSWLWQ